MYLYIYIYIYIHTQIYHHHHHHISFMELGHLLTRSGLTYPEVFSKVNGGNAILKHARPETTGSNPTTGLTLLWVRNPVKGNFNH